MEEFNYFDISLESTNGIAKEECIFIPQLMLTTQLVKARSSTVGIRGKL